MAEMWITMGPQHPMTHGLWTLRVKVDGEVVTDTEPELGYIHRAVEKIGEARDFTQFTTYCDRLCYVSANTWSHAYIYAAEDLLAQGQEDFEVPARAEHIRLIAIEMNRIASHLMWLGAYLPDVGNLTVFVWCLRERELFLDLLQELGGSRMHYNFPRVGGVKRDLPVGFARRARAKTHLFLRRMDEYEKMLDESTIFLVRTQGVGHAKVSDMIDAGVSGPNVRAGGVAYDARQQAPYSVYDELDWEIPVEKPSSRGADCYDRYRVRLEEMRISSQMILDALDRMPGGAETNHASDDPSIRAKLPERSAEGTTGMHRFEDSRGESLFYLAGGGAGRGKSPYRVSIRSPMFITIPFASETMIGYKVADIPAIMGSFDPCIGETDR